MKVGDIKQIEPNIHAGVKYMRSVLEANFKDEPMDPLNKGLFTFAAYNAGPARVRQLRREAARKGLDPNVWSAMSNRWRPSGSAVRPSPTSATSTSITLPIGSSSRRTNGGRPRSRR